MELQAISVAESCSFNIIINLIWPVIRSEVNRRSFFFSFRLRIRIRRQESLENQTRNQRIKCAVPVVSFASLTFYCVNHTRLGSCLPFGAIPKHFDPYLTLFHHSNLPSKNRFIFFFIVIDSNH